MPEQSGSFFGNWSNKEKTPCAFIKRGTWIKFYFCKFISLLRVEHQAQSRISQSRPWLQSCPGFPLSKHYTPEDTLFDCKHRQGNISKWTHILRIYSQLPKILRFLKLWIQELYAELMWMEPKCCINLRSPSSRLIKILRISTLSQIKPGSFKQASHTSHLQEMELL